MAKKKHHKQNMMDSLRQIEMNKVNKRIVYTHIFTLTLSPIT